MRTFVLKIFYILYSQCILINPIKQLINAVISKGKSKSRHFNLSFNLGIIWSFYSDIYTKSAYIYTFFQSYHSSTTPFHLFQ